MKRLILLILAVVGTASSGFGATIVVHGGSGASEITRDEVKNIFLGKSTRWQGSAVKLAVLDSGDAESAYPELTGKSASQFESYWKRLVFTGRGIMPKTFSSDADLLAYVAETPGAVGFIVGSEVIDGVVALRQK